MYCKQCGKEIPDSSIVCNFCGSNQSINNSGSPIPLQPKKKKKGIGCIGLILAIFIVGGYMVIGTNMQNSNIQKSLSGVSDSSEYITLDEYNQIEIGMTYEEVAAIVGSPGEISSQVEANGYQMITVTWYGNGVAGSSAVVSFTNGEATAKTQVGLK